MREYIVLNGIRSDSIEGLLIQTLPPITKPRMRIQTDEIDGRDGDIITRLGYSAYDKPLTIGLYGNYDVDKVIDFFDSKGTVIFSNEPDKYYHYEIIEAIDLAKLIRFKTATVTMHCQPFKYSAVDKPVNGIYNMISLADDTITKNGLTVTVNDGEISITGTPTEATEIYLPVLVKASKGNYSLKVESTVSGQSFCVMRLVDGAPTDVHSFGQTSLIVNGGTDSLDASIGADKTYRYVWIYLYDLTTAINMNFTLEMTAKQMTVMNYGNIYSKPVITIYGQGIVNLSLNGTVVLVLNIVTDYITIDVAEMQAYYGNLLMNRNVSGNYDDLALPVGKNVISWTGNVTKVIIDKYSRWR